MSYKTGILLGRIIKVQGYEGAVIIRLEKIFTDKIPEMRSVFLEIEGKPVPFFISESDYPAEGTLRLRFVGYNSFEKISEFNGSRVFLDSAEGDKVPENDFGDLTGFKIISEDKSLSGTIREITDNPGQLLMSVATEKGKVLLIPLHEDLITRIDKRKRLITMDLPEGLTEIN
jgi:16S rRNA processing protein RimM